MNNYVSSNEAPEIVTFSKTKIWIEILNFFVLKIHME